ncbi:hypothetical protein DMC14_003075 [Metamycoplasma phocicerebrale]|uniref:Uncharacterized protein n=1 Tax=Metamycoplasma phocicerebrale TaxID=142649 RepID=A0A3T0TUT2_9BACT|nr:hypothetical protein [Metamycoplasma phocicerebrale]AZZ65746.1 hypothetical protein DMC14_003075 [Metamycoplasma phocicerebrale]
MLKKESKKIKKNKSIKKKKNGFVDFKNFEDYHKECEVEQTREIEIWKNQDLIDFQEIKLKKDKKKND